VNRPYPHRTVSDSPGSRRSSIRTRLAIVLVALLLVAVAGSTVSYVLARLLVADVASRGNTAAQVERLADQGVDAVFDEESAIRDFLMTGDIAYFQAYGRAAASAFLLLDAMRAATVGRPDLVAVIDGISAAADDWEQRSADPIVAGMQAMLKSSNDSWDPQVELARLGEGRSLLATLRARLLDLRAALGAPGNEVTQGLSLLSTTSLMALVVTLTSLLVTALAAAFLLTRWVTRPLRVLVTAASRVEAGDDVPFESRGPGEIGELGRALERMRHGQREQQQATAVVAHRSSVLNRFTEATSFVTEDSALAVATLHALEEIAAPLDGAIHVSNPSRDRAVPEATLGEARGTVLTLGVMATCPGVIRGSSFVSPDVLERLAVRCPIYPIERGTLACVPLVALGDNVGVVHLHWDEPDALSLELQASLDRVSSHAALSIANRRMVSALQGMASADPRTGLLNSRAFDEAFEKELAAWRHGDLAVVLMLDLDHFKAFNDRYGHAAGDEALRAFAGVLRSCLRDDDVAARYGGEEFIVLLRGLDADAGRVVAERIRARTEATILSLAPGVTGRITVSIGVSSIPLDGLQRVPVMQAADAALYRAKQAGRNRIAWSESGVDDDHDGTADPDGADGGPSALPAADRAVASDPGAGEAGGAETMQEPDSFEDRRHRAS
jgi:diguanylate cyclase (GGDEF)-like protein